MGLVEIEIQTVIYIFQIFSKNISDIWNIRSIPGGKTGMDIPVEIWIFGS